MKLSFAVYFHENNKNFAADYLKLIPKFAQDYPDIDFSCYLIAQGKNSIIRPINQFTIEFLEDDLKDLQKGAWDGLNKGAQRFIEEQFNEPDHWLICVGGCFIIYDLKKIIEEITQAQKLNKKVIGITGKETKTNFNGRQVYFGESDDYLWSDFTIYEYNFAQKFFPVPWYPELEKEGAGLERRLFCRLEEFGGRDLLYLSNRQARLGGKLWGGVDYEYGIMSHMHDNLIEHDLIMEKVLNGSR